MRRIRKPQANPESANKIIHGRSRKRIASALMNLTELVFCFRGKGEEGREDRWSHHIIIKYRVRQKFDSYLA